MKIAVDAMGGDYAPEALAKGLLLARPQCQADLLLIGDETQIKRILGGALETLSIEVVHAPETITMAEAGPTAIRKKPDASLCVAMRRLAEGDVDAVVSAGNSSAIVATAKHFVGMIPALRRPAMAVPLPTPIGKVLLLDAGAHAEANTIHLAQSAVLAHVYLKVTEGLNHPRVGLLNIGREPLKGTKVVQRAFALLKRSTLNFVGNVEPQDLFTHATDAAICDGFVGNLVLKIVEGVTEAFMQSLETQIEGIDSEARDELQRSLDASHRTYEYQNVGGAPLLGVRRTVVVAHGRSEGPAIANAIRLACYMTRKKVYERMASELEKDSTLAELKHHITLLMLDNLKSKWGFAHQK